MAKSGGGGGWKPFSNWKCNGNKMSPILVWDKDYQVKRTRFKGKVILDNPVFLRRGGTHHRSQSHLNLHKKVKSTTLRLGNQGFRHLGGPSPILGSLKNHPTLRTYR